MLFCHFTRLALLVFGCSRTVAYACTHNLGCGVRVCVHTLYPIKKCAHFFLGSLLPVVLVLVDGCHWRAWLLLFSANARARHMLSLNPVVL